MTVMVFAINNLSLEAGGGGEIHLIGVATVTLYSHLSSSLEVQLQ